MHGQPIPFAYQHGLGFGILGGMTEGTRMGCFCVQAIEALAQEDPARDAEPDADQDAADLPAIPDVIPAVYSWLYSRLLPSDVWRPEDEWQEIELPDPPMPPESLGVLTALVQAYTTARTEFDLDLTDPDDQSKLTRIVGTLNRRTPLLEAMAEDTRPWEQVALFDDQLNFVRSAIEANQLPPPEDVEQGPPLAPWRPLIRKLRALAPLVAVGQMLDIDFAEPDATETLAKLVRDLRTIDLPPLVDSMLVLRTLARVGAIARLRASFGADPRQVPFERVTRALDRKAAEVQQLLPDHMRVEAGQLIGMPQREPNPSQFFNADTLERAQKIDPDTMRWQPPPYRELDLLTVGAPVMALARAMGGLMPSPIRTAPCGYQCDAGPAGRATRSPDSGTGAARAR